MLCCYLLSFIQAFDYDLMTAVSVYMDVNNNPTEITAQRSSSSIHHRSSSSIHHRSQRSNIDTHIPSSSSTAAASSSSAHTSRTFRPINSPVINGIDGDSHDNLGQPVPPSDALIQKQIQELIRQSISSSSSSSSTTATDLDAAFQSFMYASTMNSSSSSSSSSGGIAISDHFRHLLSSQHDVDNNDDDHHHHVSSTTRHQDVYDENGIRLPDPVQRQQLLGGGDDPLSFLSRSHHHHRSRSHGSHGHDENENDDDEMIVFARADDPSVDWMFPTPRHISYQRSFEEV